MLLNTKYLLLCVVLTVSVFISPSIATQNDEYYDTEDENIDESNLIVKTDDGLVQNELNLTASPNITLKKVFLNQNIADSFKSWLGDKSIELHEMNKNFSGFNLLNETYNVNLRKEAEFKWINFTEMILNISKTIAEELYNKTLLVEDLSKNVEEAYDEYADDPEKIADSVDFVYYDAKSPKTFCDDKKDSAKTDERRRRRSVLQRNSMHAMNELEFDFIDIKDEVELDRGIRDTETSPRRRGGRRRTRTTTVPTTTTVPLYYDDYYYDDDFYDDHSSADHIDETFLMDGYWDVECINRTFDENFITINTKMNTNYSATHIPVNVFKQSMAINMTAYWSEKLNEQFKLNYQRDPDLTWQYFCSSTGLFRRYPAAYWTAPQLQDFFDCRLQSWYIMAAASSKDVVILLDTSGSMTGLRLEIATKLIEAILDTFTDNDFFNIITFATESEYLFEETDPAYSNKFIQASKINKSKFKEALKDLNTTSQGKLTKPLIKAFNLFNKTSTSRANCNKMIMVITDGHSDDVDDVFKEYNADKSVRVFSYKIGRDMTDPKVIKDLGCNNNGAFYHVVTLTDINEHVYEYIPILSRPMALNHVHETTWSNVFLGYLDKELKISVGRPAFVNNKKMLELLKKQQLYDTLDKLSSKHPLNSSHFENYTNKTLTHFINNELYREIQEFHYDENLEYKFDSSETEESKQEKILKQANQIIKEQVLLGVVGLDVSVLKLISKVSPKFQMGVGIYMIMIDNNGFIVYHPSIKQQISLDSDSKGTSQSIDLEVFEIPINNNEEFEELEHEMIEEITNSKILRNWKREGSRVVRRKTEYVYTSILNTPFAVSIASPNSFGRYYIDLPLEMNSVYEEKIQLIRSDTLKSFETKIQLYNCSYGFKHLSKKLLDPEKYSDYCIKYLYTDLDQALALKSDLILHDLMYEKFDLSIFEEHPNLVRSAFYGTYSGATFYLPVTFFRRKTDSEKPLADKPLKDNEEPEVNYHDTSKFEKFTKIENLFGMGDASKHTYSFEKNYYTRAVEFSDELRTSNNLNDPISIYILNETTSAYKDANNETISATMPIWMENVPASVAGVVYNAKSFKDRIFGSHQDCKDESCINICSRQDLNATCYLVDEHGIIVLANDKKKNQDVVGQLLYKVNPWLMLQLEKEGIYDLIVKGNKLQECKKPPLVYSSASRLFNMIDFVFKTIGFAVVQLLQTVIYSTAQIITASLSSVVNADISNPDNVEIAVHKINQHEWKIRNSHCFYFGIYSFNMTKWQTMNSNELRTWCNKTDGLDSKKYLAGYLKHSNLMMLVVEDEEKVSQCGNIEELVKSRPPSWESRLEPSNKKNKKTSPPTTSASAQNEISPYSINRYRKDPLSYGDRKNYCHNYFANESMIFKCVNSATHLSQSIVPFYTIAIAIVSLIFS